MCPSSLSSQVAALESELSTLRAQSAGVVPPEIQGGVIVDHLVYIDMHGGEGHPTLYVGSERIADLAECPNSCAAAAVSLARAIRAHWPRSAGGECACVAMRVALDKERESTAERLAAAVAAERAHENEACALLAGTLLGDSHPLVARLRARGAEAQNVGADHERGPRPVEDGSSSHSAVQPPSVSTAGPAAPVPPVAAGAAASSAREDTRGPHAGTTPPAASGVQYNSRDTSFGGTDAFACKRCGGTGQITIAQRGAMLGPGVQRVPAVLCYGPCPACSGTGRAPAAPEAGEGEGCTTRYVGVRDVTSGIHDVVLAGSACGSVFIESHSHREAADQRADDMNAAVSAIVRAERARARAEALEEAAKECEAYAASFKRPYAETDPYERGLQSAARVLGAQVRALGSRAGGGGT